MDVLLRHNNKRHKLHIEADATLESFMRRVDALTNISPSRQVLKVGYPPQPLLRDGIHHRSGGECRRKAASLRELGIQSNELIIVEEVSPPDTSPAAAAESSTAAAACPPATTTSTPATAAAATAAAATAAAATAASARLQEQHSLPHFIKKKNGEAASAMLLSKSCPPGRSAVPHSSSSNAFHSSRSAATPGTAAAAAAEDTYQWEEEEDMTAFEEEEDDEEEAVGMPLRYLCKPSSVRREVQSVLSPFSPTAAAARGGSEHRTAAAAVVPSSSFPRGTEQATQYNVDARRLHSSSSSAAASFPLPSLLPAAAARASSPPSSSWSSSGRRRIEEEERGTRLFRAAVEEEKKVLSLFEEAADPCIVGEAVRYVVPSDNSCLFTCLSLLAAPHTTPQQLRALVASSIEADPLSFTDAVLDRPREEYMQWILSPTSWGGYVELAILAQQLQHEVVCVDVETQRKDFYGDPRTGRRIYLLYDGVHYDAIVARRKPRSPLFSPRLRAARRAAAAAERAAAAGGRAAGGRAAGERAAGERAAGERAAGERAAGERAAGERAAGGRAAGERATAAGGGGRGTAATAGGGEYEEIGEEFLRVFDPADREMEEKAAAVAAELHRRKHFTNVQQMALQCLVCGAGVRDHFHAKEHAAHYGHTNFGETTRH